MRVRRGRVEVGRGLEEKGRFQAEGHLPFSLPSVRMGEELILKAMTSACLRLFGVESGKLRPNLPSPIKLAPFFSRPLKCPACG